MGLANRGKVLRLSFFFFILSSFCIFSQFSIRSFSTNEACSVQAIDNGFEKKIVVPTECIRGIGTNEISLQSNFRPCMVFESNSDVSEFSCLDQTVEKIRFIQKLEDLDLRDLSYGDEVLVKNATGQECFLKVVETNPTMLRSSFSTCPVIHLGSLVLIEGQAIAFISRIEKRGYSNWYKLEGI